MEKWKLLTEHNKCTFCDTGIENILHLFWECEFIKEFWWKLEILVKTNFKLVNFNLKKIKVSLGEVGGEPWKNYIIMLGKRCIYQYNTTTNNNNNNKIVYLCDRLKYPTNQGLSVTMLKFKKNICYNITDIYIQM